jgi:hypothetical protein
MATEFDLASLFGGGGDSEIEKLLTPKQKEQLSMQATLAAAAQLLQAGGRSSQRIGLGQALGSALQAGQGAYERGTTSAVQNLLLGQKMQEAKRAQDLQAQVAGVLTKPPTVLSPEMQALAAPGMQVGPTVARAELAASIPQPSANEIKAGQYQQIADIYAAQGKSEDAKRYQDIAEKLNPRAEITGQPFEVTDAKGNPILVQQYKDGTVKTMQGFGPKRDVVLQNLGGQTVAIDKSKLKGNEQFAQTMTPGEVASNIVAQGNLAVNRANLGVAQGGLNLRQQEFARGAFDRVETPEGFAYVPKAPGGAAVPVMGAGGQQLKGVSGGKPTEGETNAAGFAQRMELSNSIINSLPAGSQPGAMTRTLESIPFVGGVAARSGQSAETQKFDQAAQDWIRAKLRKESGAAIGVDEARQEYATYFPMVGDTAEKIAQKAEARRVVTLGMQKAAGKAYEPYTPLAPAPAGGPSAPSAERRMVFRNGRFEFE